jgi:hypothetical protein
LGNATLHKRMVVDSARVHLTAPPPVRGASAGSLTQVGAGDVLSPKPALQAQGVGPVAVSWTDAHVDAYAAAIAPLLFKPTGCGPVSPYPGHTTCRRYTACELGYPSCGQDPTLYEVCAQDFQQECHVRGGAQLVTTWGVSQQWAASLTQGQLATRLATTVRDRLNLSYPRSLAPTRPPAGEVWLDSHPHGIALAAHVLSRGQYFRVLHAYAEEQSLRFGVPSTRWSTLAASISTDVLQGQALEDLAISPAAWREAQTWDAYVRALYTPGAALSLNALSLPYGARAAGWHPTHVGAGSSGSVLDVLARWEGVAALVAQLDDVVDGQVELATIDALIGAMTAQVTTTRDAAEVLGAAAADNAVAQQAALDQLTAVADEVGTIQGSLESEIVRIWDCDDGFASCGVAFTVAAQALTASCPDGSSFASVLQTLSTITGGLSAVSAAAAVVGTLSTVQDAIDQAQQLASTGAADLARLRAGADTLRQVRRAIKSTTSGVKALASVVKTLRNLSDAAIADCEGTPVATQIQQLQTELALLEALSASLEAQLGVLDGLIASVTAHLTHLVTSAQALDRAAAGSDAVLEDLANVHGHGGRHAGPPAPLYRRGVPDDAGGHARRAGGSVRGRPDLVDRRRPQPHARAARGAARPRHPRGRTGHRPPRGLLVQPVGRPALHAAADRDGRAALDGVPRPGAPTLRHPRGGRAVPRRRRPAAQAALGGVQDPARRRALGVPHHRRGQLRRDAGRPGARRQRVGLEPLGRLRHAGQRHAAAAVGADRAGRGLRRVYGPRAGPVLHGRGLSARPRDRRAVRGGAAAGGAGPRLWRGRGPRDGQRAHPREPRCAQRVPGRAAHPGGGGRAAVRGPHAAGPGAARAAGGAAAVRGRSRHPGVAAGARPAGAGHVERGPQRRRGRRGGARPGRRDRARARAPPGARPTATSRRSSCASSWAPRRGARIYRRCISSSRAGAARRAAGRRRGGRRRARRDQYTSWPRARRSKRSASCSSLLAPFSSPSWRRSVAAWRSFSAAWFIRSASWGLWARGAPVPWVFMRALSARARRGR